MEWEMDREVCVRVRSLSRRLSLFVSLCISVSQSPCVCVSVRARVCDIYSFSFLLLFFLSSIVHKSGCSGSRVKYVSWFVNNETTTQVVLFAQWRRRCLDLVPFSSNSDQTVPTLLAYEPPEITLKKVVLCDGTVPFKKHAIYQRACGSLAAHPHAFSVSRLPKSVGF